MKYIFTLLFSIVLSFAYSQAPPFINYQGVARDAAGLPVTNTVVGLQFSISTLTNPSFHTETQANVPVNALGLFNTKIGVSPQLPASGWENLPVILNVSISFNGGPFTPLGSQTLASVPFALYALNSGNTPLTYSSSSNVTITAGNVLDLTSSGVTSGIYGDNTGANSTIPTFSVDSKGRLITASSYTANTTGDIGGKLDNQIVNKLKGIPLSATIPSTGQVLQYNGTNWGPANIATGGVTNINTTAPLAGGPITSVGSISLQTSGVTPGSYGVSPNIIPTFSVDVFGRVMSAGSYTLPAAINTLSGNVQGPFATTTVTALQNVSVSAISPTLNQILAYNGSVWAPFSQTFATAPWVKTGSTVTLTTNSDAVGIGAASPVEKLQIETGAATRASIISSNNSIGALWFGYTGIHNSGIIQYDNLSNEMNFGTATALNRFRIFGSGNAAFGSTLSANPVGAFVNFCKQGANDTKVLISGGDNNNNWGGMLSFGENESASQGMTIKLDAGGNRLLFTNDINGSSPVMVIGGYSGSNAGVTMGAGYAFSQAPINGLAVQGNVGIGTTAPTNPLHVQGTVRIVDGTQGLNKVLTSDATGVATWKQMAVGFKVEGTASQSIPTAAYTTVAYDNTIFDDAGAFNLGTETYVVPSAGVYCFTSAIYWPSYPGTRPFLEILVNGGTAATSMIYCASGSQLVQQVTTTIKLNAGDLVTSRVYNNAATTNMSGVSSQQGTLFSGFKVY